MSEGMKKEVIVGVDVSKAWLDVYIIYQQTQSSYCRVDNSKTGILKLFRWIKETTDIDSQNWLFCMEHTGLYSYQLNSFLQDRSVYQTMVNPLAIKKSMGIIRGKTDKADARVIALYANRFQDNLKEFTLPSKSLQKLKILLSQRERMVDMKRQITLAIESFQELPKELTHEMVAQNKKLSTQLKANIQNLDHQILQTVKEDQQLNAQSKVIQSVPGVGPQTSAHILVTTQGMTHFKTSRQYACYCGVAPFEYSSGSSYRSKTKVHFLANRKMKSLLHMAAMSTIARDGEMKLYYDRKRAEGKNAMSVINAIRFKIIDRIFAVVKRNECYNKNHSVQLSKA
jgi:transposase